jgi:serine/threonine protein kinase
VLVDDKDVCKICDFNISAVMKKSQLEPANVFIGTRLYSPPELNVKSFSK